MKKLLYALVTILFFSNCNQAQNTDSTTLKKDSVKCEAEVFGADSTNVAPKKYEETEFTVFEIDTVPDITAKNRRSAKFINKRLELLIGKSMKARCDSIGLTYPPKFVLHRAFKHEGEYEIWAGSSRSDSLRLLAILPICAVDNYPGTKLEQGDGKTPEGFYKCTVLYGSSMSFMWMNLNESKIDDYGEVGGQCSSFKICLDYPLAVDSRRTRKFMPKGTSPGSAICIHANCVTAGCISFENKNYLPVFLSQIHHNSAKYGKVMVHIFPYRFDKQDADAMAAASYTDMKSKDLKLFWKEIEKGHTLFEKTRKAFWVSYKGEKYNFTTYK